MGGLIHIRTYLDLEEAVVARSLLEARGIEILLLYEGHSSVDPFVRLGLGGHPLVATAEYCEAAQRTLAEVEAGQRRDHIEIECCDNCGTSTFKRRRNYLWSVVAFLYYIPSAPYAGRKKCAICKAPKGEEFNVLGRILMLVFGAVLLLYAAIG